MAHKRRTLTWNASSTKRTTAPSNCSLRPPRLWTKAFFSWTTRSTLRRKPPQPSLSAASKIWASKIIRARPKRWPKLTQEAAAAIRKNINEQHRKASSNAVVQAPSEQTGPTAPDRARVANSDSHSYTRESLVLTSDSLWARRDVSSPSTAEPQTENTNRLRNGRNFFLE